MSGRVVLVTGAGGYIGSALAAALAEAGAERIVLLDASENNLFRIGQRFEANYARVPRETILGSVTAAVAVFPPGFNLTEATL